MLERYPDNSGAARYVTGIGVDQYGMARSTKSACSSKSGFSGKSRIEPRGVRQELEIRPSLPKFLSKIRIWARLFIIAERDAAARCTIESGSCCVMKTLLRNHGMCANGRIQFQLLRLVSAG